jgi:hypothetical protein
LQRVLVDQVLAVVPVSAHVYSKRGRDVVQNARQHLNRKYMVVMDVRDCYPSTSHRMVNCALRRSGFDDGSAGLVSRLTTYSGRLPQGPPTSSALLNLVLADTDAELAALAAEYDSTYTRYADDLCFSADAPLHQLRRRAARILHVHGYQINDSKCRTWGPNDRHTITNILVDTALHPDPNYVRAVVELLRSGGARLDSVRGQVNWMVRLDPSIGQLLQRELSHYRRQQSQSSKQLVH